MWDHTHTDIHPARMGYDDVLAEFLEYADAVKAVDPSAQITGPVSWGWSGYLYSALDRADDNFRAHTDSARHGGGPFLPWFLKAVRDHDARTGRRSLDVLDVHYYPQGAGVYGGADDPDTQERRLRATRALWDPGYVDESWIGEPVRLLPRLREWIDAGYPGTKIGVTEWNFGADGHIDGALAIAEALGIYGREGVYLANYWAFPRKDSPGYLAFKLLRNPDGAGHGLGDQSVRAVSGAPGNVAAFAAVDTATGDLTLLLINKMGRTTETVPLTLAGPPTGRGIIKGWRLGRDAAQALETLPEAAVEGSSATVVLPPRTATLLRVHALGTSASGAH
jgi:hypothetical protein